MHKTSPVLVVILWLCVLSAFADPGWYEFTPPTDLTATALDLSFLNDHPAGAHGFVQAKDGHLFFEDGQRARFWGTDLVGPDIFIPHERADALAVKLSRMGVNMLRLHMPDTDWSKNNFFDPDDPSTQRLDPGQVDKFDYLVSALKKRGIYLYVDWLALRKFRAGDKVEAFKELKEGAKGVVHFDPRIIELTQKYVRQVLGHVNPYTGTALKDDPVYVCSEIVNESSIFCSYGEQDFPAYYWDELQRLYREWGGHGELTRFKFDWSSHQVHPVRNPGNAAESMAFLLDRMTKTNLEMKAFLSRLSPHALLAGSNMGLALLGNIKADSAMDFMDAHAYADLPNVKDWSRAAYALINNTPQIKNPFSSMVFKLSGVAVLGKPMAVSEWNECFPNEYRLEGPLFMAAYGCLQDWDILLQYRYGLDPPGSGIMKTLEINLWPDNEPAFQAGALIFRGQRLRPSGTVVIESIPDRKVFENGMRSDWLYDHRWLPFCAQVRKAFTGEAEPPAPDLSALDGLHPEADKKVRGSTGEVRIDYGGGNLKLNSPWVQGFTGALGTGTEFATLDLSLTLSTDNSWASVTVLPLDNKPLEESGRIAVIVAAPSMNTGEAFYPLRKSLSEQGGLPVLLKTLEGSLALRLKKGPFTVTALDRSGNRSVVGQAAWKDGKLQFPLSASDHAGCYLVESSRP